MRRQSKAHRLDFHRRAAGFHQAPCRPGIAERLPIFLSAQRIETLRARGMRPKALLANLVMRLSGERSLNNAPGVALLRGASKIPAA